MRPIFSKSGRALGLTVAAALMLGGCGPLISFGDNGPAADVYTLDYKGALAPEQKEGPLLYFDEPHVAEGLAGRNIAVRLGAHKRSTLANARWVTGLTTLVRDYLTRSLSDEAKARAIGEGSLDVKVDCRLGMKVWSFDFVPGQKGEDDAVDVTIELTLIRLRDGHFIGQHTFVQTPSVKGPSDDDVMDAFNVAMRTNSRDMAKWLSALKDQCVAPAS